MQFRRQTGCATAQVLPEILLRVILYAPTTRVSSLRITAHVKTPDLLPSPIAIIQARNIPGTHAPWLSLPHCSPRRNPRLTWHGVSSLSCPPVRSVYRENTAHHLCTENGGYRVTSAQSTGTTACQHRYPRGMHRVKVIRGICRKSATTARYQVYTQVEMGVVVHLG